eukprot:comp16920_c0_seq1/m.15474 comp16920_c0_seq1/g.15474  ORF comp16920_c0_seq1/g.15474 comp16920_c0_seq1/m.15474 type:complete len:501 (+) comp16920_c0_seq1:1792-3294(+)
MERVERAEKRARVITDGVINTDIIHSLNRIGQVLAGNTGRNETVTAESGPVLNLVRGDIGEKNIFGKPLVLLEIPQGVVVPGEAVAVAVAVRAIEIEVAPGVRHPEEVVAELERLHVHLVWEVLLQPVGKPPDAVESQLDSVPGAGRVPLVKLLGVVDKMNKVRSGNAVCPLILNSRTVKGNVVNGGGEENIVNVRVEVHATLAEPHTAHSPREPDIGKSEAVVAESVGVDHEVHFLAAVRCGADESAHPVGVGEGGWVAVGKNDTAGITNNWNNGLVGRVSVDVTGRVGEGIHGVHCEEGLDVWVALLDERRVEVVRRAHKLVHLTRTEARLLANISANLLRQFIVYERNERVHVRTLLPPRSGLKTWVNNIARRKNNRPDFVRGGPTVQSLPLVVGESRGECSVSDVVGEARRVQNERVVLGVTLSIDQFVKEFTVRVGERVSVDQFYKVVVLPVCVCHPVREDRHKGVCAKNKCLHSHLVVLWCKWHTGHEPGAERR